MYIKNIKSKPLIAIAIKGLLGLNNMHCGEEEILFQKKLWFIKKNILRMQMVPCL